LRTKRKTDKHHEVRNRIIPPKGDPMNEVFDYGTGVPYTDDDLDTLFRGKVAKIRLIQSCANCIWFDVASCELCRGPVTCIKWSDCGKCCPLTGRTSLVDFETCPQFKVDQIMCQ
jgi:hypothetical protein